MASLLLPILTVWAVVFAVPMVVYGAGSALTGMKPPTQASPARFLAGVAVTKLGTAAVFVWLFAQSRELWSGGWVAYGAAWFAMFAASEAGDWVSGRSKPVEAVLGVVSEAVYAPLSAYLVARMLG